MPRGVHVWIQAGRGQTEAAVLVPWPAALAFLAGLVLTEGWLTSNWDRMEGRV